MSDATFEPLIFILKLNLMIDEHGDEGEDIDTDEIENVDEPESKGLNCRGLNCRCTEPILISAFLSIKKVSFQS